MTVAFVQISFLVVYISIYFLMFSVGKGLSSSVRPIDRLLSDASHCFLAWKILFFFFLTQDKTHIDLAFFLVLRDPFFFSSLSGV